MNDEFMLLLYIQLLEFSIYYLQNFLENYNYIYKNLEKAKKFSCKSKYMTTI